MGEYWWIIPEHVLLLSIRWLTCTTNTAFYDGFGVKFKMRPWPTYSRETLLLDGSNMWHMRGQREGWHHRDRATDNRGQANIAQIARKRTHERTNRDTETALYAHTEPLRPPQIIITCAPLIFSSVKAQLKITWYTYISPWYVRSVRRDERWINTRTG